MGRLNITVVDATGNKEQQATVPDDAPIRRVIAKLVELMNLPVNGPDGQPLNYKFHHKASGRQLDGEQTLKDAGVQEGDVLRLYPEITAGARPGRSRLG